ncbi:GTPase-associated protein 1-related protein [Kitasatospora sp. NBC_01266]|uniref:GTPase-associated protein 1-related protein n=1 Tax=Kitasatospora sp. NBC_01266 TaxID=2903572 RepID=UPI002E36399E|nr:GTPase-associated protein 1-related protein [Kitasatospora sp. NBC_01266]
MALEQLHYTSAPPGPDGSGFRFTAVSAGIGPEILRQAEPVLGYEPPRDAPARPDDAELASFPVTLAFTRLADGSGLLSRTVYTGADYTGRYGNFHAHAVHLPHGAVLPGRLLPVEAWGSPTWRSTDPGNSTTEPLAEFAPGGTFGREVLTRFARERGDRLAAFLADVRELFAEQAGPQLVLVEQDPSCVARWVALACGALPARYAAELTFTTYTRRPYRSKHMVVGIRQDAEFGFGPAELDHQYRVHHGAGGPSSPARSSLWAQVAAQVWLAGRPELFRRATNGRAAAETTDRLDEFGTGRLAALALGAGIDPTADGLHAAVDWACGHAREYDEAFWCVFVEGMVASAANGKLTSEPEFGRLGAALCAAGWPECVTDMVATAAVRAVLRAPSSTGAVDRRLLRLSTAATQVLAAEIGAALRAVVSDGVAPLQRILVLLEIAEQLGVEPGSESSHLAGRLAEALVGSGGQTAERASALLGREYGASLCSAVLDRLNDIVLEGDPWAATTALANRHIDWKSADLAEYPHLRMVLAAPAGAGGLPLLRHLLNAPVVLSVSEDPSLLRTVYRLAWPTARPGIGDALELLAMLGSDRLRSAGLQHDLVAVALGSTPDDVHAPALAAALLRGGMAEGREAAALEALVHSAQVSSGEAGSGFTGRALALAYRARPLEPAIARLLDDAVANRVLVGFGPSAWTGTGVCEVLLAEELVTLANSGDEGLLSAYQRLAGETSMLDRMRSDLRYPAACFVAWQSMPGASQLWDRTRQRLLTEVLKPLLRRLSPDELAEIGRMVGRAPFKIPSGGSWAEQWKGWHRPGLAERFGLRRRSERTARPTAHGRSPDLAPPPRAENGRGRDREDGR